jgi:hypothetical protein
VFVEFLLEYGASAEYRDLRDGERLARRFEAAGFGDFFWSSARITIRLRGPLLQLCQNPLELILLPPQRRQSAR